MDKIERETLRDIIAGWKSATFGWNGTNPISYEKARADHAEECIRRIEAALAAQPAEPVEPPKPVADALDRMDALLDPKTGLLTVGYDSATVVASRRDMQIIRAACAASSDEIEQLRADLISCRGTVKTERNHYERLAAVHGKTPHGAAYEAEAQRLDALLDRIDAMMKDKP